MAHYLLSVHSVDGELREPMTDDAMKESFRQIGILEAEMKSSGSWVFSGRLKTKLEDGTEDEAGPGDAIFTPAGHDAWVVGGEPVILLDFKGAATYAKK